MDALTVYLVLQADVFRSFFAMLSIVSFLLIIPLLLVIADNACDYKKGKRLLTIWGVVVFGACIITSALPSTRTLAAMIVLPELVNNEQIQNEAGELYGLAKEALKQAVQQSK